jgi:hypothetical protein
LAVCSPKSDDFFEVRIVCEPSGVSAIPLAILSGLRAAKTLDRLLQGLNSFGNLRQCHKLFESLVPKSPPSKSICHSQSRSYNAPMLDIKLVREKPDFVRERLATRGAGEEAQVDELLKLDEQRRKLLAEVESLKAQRNRDAKEIGTLMAQKKAAEAESKKETRELASVR